MTETQRYEVVRSIGRGELRRYAPHVVAEVRVHASFHDAGNQAFRALAAYIRGANVAAGAPAGDRVEAQTGAVTTSGDAGSETVAMTTPVTQVRERGSYVVAFVLPASLTIDSAPRPTDPSVQLRAVDEQLAAALRYSGRWTQDVFQTQLSRLEREVRAAWLAPAGEPWLARFNPPMVPWFLRRNEVVLPVTEVANDAPGGLAAQGM